MIKKNIPFTIVKGYKIEPDTGNAVPYRLRLVGKIARTKAVSRALEDGIMVGENAVEYVYFPYEMGYEDFVVHGRLVKENNNE